MSISPHLSAMPPPTTNREQQQMPAPATNREQQPATMAEAATPLFPGLPDDLVLWEILVRLDPKSLLRCRAVARAWRRAASTRRLLQAHHDRQPTLPLIHCSHGFHQFLDIISFDHRADDQLQPVARLRHDLFSVKASCDGLLVLFDYTSFAVCNPVTRQYAPLPMLSAFTLLGMYPHRPTGEYRLLLYRFQWMKPGTPGQDGPYVFTLGSGQPPRLIGLPDAELLACGPGSVLFRGNLHWHSMQHDSYSNVVMVFDTIAESCRQMRSPVLLGNADLFEMDGMLGVSRVTFAATAIDIWMMLDYEAEVWALKYRVELGNPDYRFHNYWNAVVAPWDGGLLVLFEFHDRLLEVDIHGKVVAGFHHTSLSLTQHRLKQSLVSHAFFSTLELEGYAVNALPFI